jgi:hypothetical protein
VTGRPSRALGRALSNQGVLMETIKNLIKQIVVLFLPPEQKEVIAVLESYAAAFLTFKPCNVIDYFDRPLTLLLDTGPEAFDTTEQVT